MNPYYNHNGITIYHGDCLDILPVISGVDLVLTDPPYGVGLDYNSYNDSREGLSRIIGDIFPLILDKAPLVALTPGIANLWLYPQPTWVLCLHTPGAVSSGKWGFNEWQPVIVYGQDPYLANKKGRRPDVVRGTSEKNIFSHPCPKPTKTWKLLLHRLTAGRSDCVLDPFMGSGTTLFAAKEAGLKAIGVEIDEKYCEIAAKRLSQESLFRDL